MSGPKNPDYRIERILLTPAMAAKLLEFNKKNRVMSDAHMHRIAEKIANGKWRFNGDSIKVSKSGDVLDGQHRLWAVIETQIAIDTIVIYGLEEDAFATIDTIRRLRTHGDTLSVLRVDRNRNVIATALAWLLRWQRGHIELYRTPEQRIENADIEKAFKDHPRMGLAVERMNRLRSLANPGLLAFFYYVLTNRNEDLAERFAVTLEDPSGVAVSDPVYRLRAHFLAQRGTNQKPEPLRTIALMIKAANAASRNDKIQALIWRNQGKKAESFPQLEVK